MPSASAVGCWTGDIDSATGRFKEYYTQYVISLSRSYDLERCALSATRHARVKEHSTEASVLLKTATMYGGHTDRFRGLGRLLGRALEGMGCG